MTRRTLALAAAAWMAVGMAATAQVVPGAIQVVGDITSNTTWSADNIYQINGTVKVLAPATLTIEAGSLIYGNAVTVRNCIQVERGAKIIAKGTAQKPIIFSSAKAQGAKAPGDWGGIIVLGQATINSPGGTNIVEGGTGGVYGGNNDADNSGEIEYVRIEYGGQVFATDNEINGLTLAGVGNGTNINHVQASYINDDAFEWFGGTVNGRNLIALGAIDDDFDTDLGYRGRLQFIYAQKDSLWSDLSASSSSNGFEADNDATGTANAPLSKPIVSNATIVGPWRDNTIPDWGQDFTRGAHLRRNTDYGIFNSVITGWNVAMRIDGATMGVACPQNSDLAVQNSVVTGTIENNGTQPPLGDVSAWFDCSGAGNTRLANHPDAMLVGVTQTNLTNPDPRPAPGSPAVTGASFSNGLLAAGNNFTFGSTTYRGAFDPSLSRDAQWDKPWSNYNPQHTTYVKHKAGWNLVSLANTPANADKNAVFPNNNSNAFRFNSGYQVDNTLDPKVGYWILLSDNRTIEQVGATVSLPQTINVQPGWNLIATGSSQYAPVASLTASGTTILSSFFAFDNGYQPVASAGALAPGRAYWVNVSAAGTITFNP